jgi:phage shock protein C
MNDIRSSLARQGLVRPRQRLIGGVCAGVGRRFGLTPWVTRLLFVLLLMVVPGSQLLIYPVLWVLMPAEERLTYPTASSTASPDAQGPTATMEA